MIAVSKEDSCASSSIAATIAAAALALAGVGLAIRTAPSDARVEASGFVLLLPYIEQDSLPKSMDV